jgi:hypothetical protein
LVGGGRTRVLFVTQWVTNQPGCAQRARIAQAHRDAARRRVGAVLRPGVDTPLWNALVADIRTLLWRRGEKVLLARLLGIPRQRVHDFIVGRGRMPDAERTLLLMEWLAARKRSRTTR